MTETLISQRTEDNISGAGGQDTKLELPEPTLATMQSDAVWFDDGNIILQAGNTQFKVHRGVLAKHSPVFAELFQVPQPMDGPIVDGCPVVRLPDDAADVSGILSALYGDTESLGSDGVLYFESMKAIVRLGKKYQIDHLCNEGLRCLRREFPTTLEEFDKVNPDDYMNFYSLGSGDDTKEADAMGTVFATIKLAHECNIQSILPALYLLGTSFKLEAFLYHKSASSVPYDAMRSCIYGREQLFQAWTSEGCDPPSPGTNCLSKPECNAAMASIVKVIASKPPPDLSAVLLPWKQFVDSWSSLKAPHKHLCDKCKRAVQGSHDGWRRVAWDALPSYFKLGRWEDLRD